MFQLFDKLFKIFYFNFVGATNLFGDDSHLIFAFQFLVKLINGFETLYYCLMHIYTILKS